jgi:hypothetical protein
VAGNDADPIAQRTLSCGDPWITRSAKTDRVALATPVGELIVFDLSPPAVVGSFPYPGEKVAVADDGTFVVVAGPSRAAQYMPNLGVRIYALPSGEKISSFGGPNTSSIYHDFRLAGTTLAVLTGAVDSTTGCARFVTDIAQRTTRYCDTVLGAHLGAGSVELSPSGKRFAVASTAMPTRSPRRASTTRTASSPPSPAS